MDFLFKQQFTGEYTNKNFKHYFRRHTDDEGADCIDIHDGDGVLIHSEYFHTGMQMLRSILPLKSYDVISILSYFDQKGRNSDMEVKIGAGHLTVGTRVLAVPSCDRNAVADVYGVMNVTRSVSGCWVVETFERKFVDPGIEGVEPYWEHFTFNIDKIEAILKRPTENGPAHSPSELVIKFPEWVPRTRFIDESCFMSAVTAGMEGTAFESRSPNYGKMMKRLKAMGMIKTVKAKPFRRYSFDDVFTRKKPTTFVDFKRAAAFLKKNPHWAFSTIKQSVEYYESLWMECDYGLLGE